MFMCIYLVLKELKMLTMIFLYDICTIMLLFVLLQMKILLNEL